MFRTQLDPVKAAREYVDAVGERIKNKMKEALDTKTLSDFKRKMDELEKIRDDELNSERYISAENIIKEAEGKSISDSQSRTESGPKFCQ